MPVVQVGNVTFQCHKEGGHTSKMAVVLLENVISLGNFAETLRNFFLHYPLYKKC
jgi:hypothetical protein